MSSAAERLAGLAPPDRGAAVLDGPPKSAAERIAAAARAVPDSAGRLESLGDTMPKARPEVAQLARSLTPPRKRTTYFSDEMDPATGGPGTAMPDMNPGWADPLELAALIGSGPTFGVTGRLVGRATTRWGEGLAARVGRAALTGGAANAQLATLNELSKGENPLPQLPGAVAMGAVMGAPFGLRGVTRARPAVAPEPVAPVAEAVAAPVAPEPSPASLVPKAGAPPKQPFTGETAQQVPQPVADVVQQIRSDPDYLARLKRLGGGRIRTNEETLAKALTEGPMHPDEIAAWKAETPLNAVQQTRALITQDWYQQRFLKALAAGDDKAAGEAVAAMGRIGPGVQNIRATGGRTTQAQAMFVQDKVAAAYTELADMRAKGVPFEQIREAANQRLRELERDEAIRGAWKHAEPWVRGIEQYATFAKLTSPVTHAVNSVSNVLTYLAQPLEKMPRAAVLAAQGDRAGAQATLRYMYGTTSGFTDGFRKYVSTLMDDVPEMGKASEAGRQAFKWPRALRPFDVFRQLSAADAFWKAVHRDTYIHEKALASGLREGLKGEALAKRVSELSSAPPAAWLQKGGEIAREITFQEAPDSFLQSVARIRNVPGMRLVIPFIQTPYNLVKYQFQRSPAGIMSPRNLSGLTTGGAPQAEAAGRLTQGAILALGAWMMVKRGEVTGPYPTDPGERAVWDAEGRRPYSVRVGKGWLQYNRFQPVGLYLGQAAAMEDALKHGDEEGVAEGFSRLASFSAKQVADLPFVTGLSSLMDAIQDPGRSATRFVSQTATGLVPNILRDVRYQVDPVQREARGTVASLKNMIPGLSQTLPAKVDVLGREQRYSENRAARASKVFSLSGVTKEGDALKAAGSPVSEPSPVLRRYHRTVRLEGKAREAFEREMGEATKKAVERVSRGSYFAKLSPEERERRVRKAVEDARSVVRARWTRREVKREPRLLAERAAG